MGFRQASTRVSIREEWNEEEDVRNMYNVAPPAEVIFDDSENDSEDGGGNEYDIDQEVIYPHPSILNQTRRAKSLRRLASGSSIDTSSVGSMDKRNVTGPSMRAAANQPSGGSRCDIECGEDEVEEDGLVGESIHLLSPSPFNDR